MKFPHWILKAATVSGARNNNTQMPKFDGFQRCRPFTRRTYFDMIEITLHKHTARKPASEPKCRR